MSRRAAPWVGLVLLWSMAGLGCSSVRSRVPWSTQGSGGKCDTSSLLRETVALAASDAEITSARNAFEHSRTDCDRFRLALLSVGSENRRNAGYAADLMEQYLSTTRGSGDLRGLAQVLVRAFREEIAADTRLRAAHRKVADEQTRSETLRRQVEELKDIEKIIKDREKR